MIQMMRMLRVQSGVLILLISLFFGAGALAQTNGTLNQRVESVMNRPEFAHAFFGVEVYSLDSGKVLYAHNAEKFFVPGSTTKTLTEGTALELLGANYRFHTRVYGTGKIADGTLDGDVVLVASGDPNLSGRIQPDGTLAFENSDHSYAADMLDAKAVPGNPLAVIAELASQIASRGIRKVRGRVLVDTSLFPEGKPEAGTGVIVSPIAVNDNVVDITVTPGAHPGDAASISVSPETSYVKVVNHVVTGKPDSDRELAWGADTSSNEGMHAVILEGSVPAGKPASLFPYNVPSPSRFAEVVLSEALQRAGVAIENTFNGAQPDFSALAKSYTPGDQIAEHISPPLSEEIKVTLKVSQNLHATMTPYILGAVLAHHHDDADMAGLDLEHGFLEKAGLDLTQASQAEGAGGPGAYFTPDFMVHYLSFMSHEPNFELFYRALPVLGRDGTLYNLLVDSPAAGHVHAKTGTFAEYNALDHKLMVTGKGLVGYIDTADGRHLVIAAYVNNVSTAPNFEAVEKVGNALAEIAAAAYEAR
jgi:PBP4 family serine-type D-alanyl-D-alanine carboxypeptidase